MCTGWMDGRGRPPPTTALGSQVLRVRQCAAGSHAQQVLKEADMVLAVGGEAWAGVVVGGTIGRGRGREEAARKRPTPACTRLRSGRPVSSFRDVECIIDGYGAACGGDRGRRAAPPPAKRQRSSSSDGSSGGGGGAVVAGAAMEEAMEGEGGEDLPEIPLTIFRCLQRRRRRSSIPPAVVVRRSRSMPTRPGCCRRPQLQSSPGLAPPLSPAGTARWRRCTCGWGGRMGWAPPVSSTGAARSCRRRTER